MKYLVSSIIHIVSFFGIDLGLMLLNMFGKLPDLWFVVCITIMEVVFLYATSLALVKYQVGGKSNG